MNREINSRQDGARPGEARAPLPSPSRRSAPPQPSAAKGCLQAAGVVGAAVLLLFVVSFGLLIGICGVLR